MGMKTLWPLARLFLWLGAVSFGGPLAHIALMQREIVEKRGWMSRQEFLDLAGAMNLIPGPNSTELAMAIGRRRAGTPGLWVAGLAFIAPAFCIVLAVALFYARLGQQPVARALLYGVQPVVIAIIVQAGARLLPSACKDRTTRGLGLAAFALAATHLASELAILLASAALGLGLGWLKARREKSQPQVLAAENSEANTAAEASTATEAKKAGWLVALMAGGAGAKCWGLFWSFLKIGSILYGSGYVLLAFLRGEFVPRYLSDAQLLDAVAIGQLTPGPVFTTATFIGALLGGPGGAVAATAGIFLPSFLLVGWLLKVLERLQTSTIARSFLDMVNAASLALMGAVALQLGRAAIVDGFTLSLALLALGVLWRTRWNSAWLIGAGALAGVLKFEVAKLLAAGIARA